MANENELRIVAAVIIKPEHKEELLKIFQEVVKETRKEEGNVSYGLYENVSDPNKYTFIEVWKSQAAIDSHNASKHFQAFVKAIDGKVESLSVDVLQAKY
ncbi:putative quinol monooxygenase [Parabacteroides sp. Marseille-P3160]|uniref:putative quinol monooxygenase n=1 Tax=Parabacteroides sp. Marseille-P3160 TaxID=1917887 RepID=UPI0009BACB56|nr:putative quinol monooxygenase [Parabacteroides sp. Marseille-P3160]